MAKKKTMTMTKKSKILESVHSAASDLHAAGLMDKVTMREFDVLCLTPVVELSARRIQQIRREFGVSQQVFALYLNTTSSTVQKWERGDKSPSGTSLKL